MFFDSITIFIVILSILISVIRGFVKELSLLICLLLSVFFTVRNYEFFIGDYSKYFESKVTQSILSITSMFVVVNFILILINNWLMHMLAPIRLGLVDRVSGTLIGVLRGIFLSYLLLFTVHLYHYTVYPKMELKESVLPNWIINSYSYRTLFVTTGKVLEKYITESLILKVQEIGKKVVNQ